MRTFNVDMIPGGSQTAVACNQYERGDIWVFALYYDGGRFDIPAGATVSITGQKSDGTAFNVPAAISDNTVLVTVTEQMTAAYGKCVAEILVQNGDTVLYTANFYILVEVAAVQVPLADTTLPLSITAQDGTVYVQSDLEEATEQMITLAAQQQYQQDLASGVAQRVVEQYAGSTLAGSKQTVKSAIDALNSNATWKKITLTAGNNVTIQYQMAYEFGGILFMHFRWQATAQLEYYQAVVYTGKAAKMSWNVPLMSNVNIPVQGYALYADTGNDSVRASGTIPAGTYRTYIVIPIN